MDGIIYDFVTPGRQTFFDVEMPDTGAETHLRNAADRTLEKEAQKKISKHARNVELHHHGDFLPLVVSVYGTTGIHCQRFVHQCTEQLTGTSLAARMGGDFSAMLHLQRAKLQAAIWRAVAKNIVGDSTSQGQKAVKIVRDEEIKAMQAAQLPWMCVVSDAQGPSHEL